MRIKSARKKRIVQDNLVKIALKKRPFYAPSSSMTYEQLQFKMSRLSFSKSWTQKLGNFVFVLISLLL